VSIETDSRLILLDDDDNVLVARAGIYAGETIKVSGENVALPETIGMGHKLARRAISSGEPVVKYGAVIGSAMRAIALGEHVHLQNVKSNYTPTYALDEAKGTAVQPGKGDA
jgi:hypothetical protein